MTTTVTPLAIRELQVHDLRCHHEMVWKCESGLNLLVGPNGSGKTTMLEAVYLMAHGRSFRQARDPDLTARSASSFRLQGAWQRYGPMQISVKGRRGNVSIRLQGREIQRRKEVTESFPVLVESPQGRKIIDGATGERRRWLDGLVMTCYPGLVGHYERYFRSVMQRARLLRKRAGNDELDVWEHQIVHHGFPVVEARSRLLEELNALLANEHVLTEKELCLQLSAPQYEKQAWTERLKEKRIDDQRSGGLRFGPHCDALSIICDGREIRSAGSRGQQKLAAIALKMAECALWERYRRLMPVLLLDDCLEALDTGRQERLLRRLAVFGGQTLMTAPVAVTVPEGVNIAIREIGGQLPADISSDGLMEEAA